MDVENGQWAHEKNLPGEDKLLLSQALQSSIDALTECSGQLQQAQAANAELTHAVEELRQKKNELVAAQQRIEATRQWYETLFDNGPDGYLLTDREGLIREANQAAGRLLNAPQESLVSTPLGIFVSPEERPDFDAWLAQLGGPDHMPVAEMAVRLRADGPFTVALSLAVERDVSRQVTSLRWRLRDISERKRIEAELRKSAGQYQLLVDRLPAGVLVHAADRRIVLSNLKASQLLGLSREQMEGKTAADPIWQFLREDSSPMRVEEYPAERVFATGQAVSYQLVGIRRQTTGDLVWMLAHAYPDLDEHGQVQRTVVMLTDISRRKQVEAALQRSETRYRELYHSAQRQAQEAALLDRVRSVVASELELPVVIRKVVGAIAETFGYPLVSLYLRQGQVLRLQHQVGYDSIIAEIPVSRGVLGKVVRTGQPVLLKDIATDPDYMAAVPGILSEVCVPLFDRGETVGALNIEAKEAALTEADLQLLAALGEQVGIALGRARLYTQVREDAATKAVLLHEVNHRVKNNLSAIIGLLQLQEDYIQGEVARAAYHTLVGEVVGRIESLAALHDLLSANAWAPLPVHDLAERIIQAAGALSSRYPDLTVEISPSPVQVTSKQASALALIFNELATNSCKHALPDTPALHLSLDIRQEAGQIELEYHDSGPGFPAPVLRDERQGAGLHLIKLLTRHDLRGKLQLSNHQGAVVRLRFAAPGHEALVPAPTGPLSIPVTPA